MTLWLGECTLAGKMEGQHKTLLEQILFRRKITAIEMKEAEKKAIFEEKTRQEQINADFEKFIKPIERDLSQKLPIKFVDVFEEFNQKLGNFPKELIINWGTTNKEELLQENKNNSLRPPKIKIVYSYTTPLEPYSRGGGGGYKYYFGFEWTARDEIPTKIHWFLGDNKFGLYDGSENKLTELVNFLADAIENRSLLLERSIEPPDL